jgi:acyl-CoA reductase-like NAD-dependent aldehyde dehydrogenase
MAPSPQYYSPQVAQKTDNSQSELAFVEYGFPTIFQYHREEPCHRTRALHVRQQFHQSALYIFLYIFSVTSASPYDVRATIHHAQMTFREGSWSGISPLIRSAVLSGLARLLEQKMTDFAKIESFQTGRCIKEMTIQLSRLPEWLYVSLR